MAGDWTDEQNDATVAIAAGRPLRPIDRARRLAGDSFTTRLTPLTSLMMRVATWPMNFMSRYPSLLSATIAVAASHAGTGMGSSFALAKGLKHVAIRNAQRPSAQEPM